MLAISFHFVSPLPLSFSVVDENTCDLFQSILLLDKMLRSLFTASRPTPEEMAVTLDKNSQLAKARVDVIVSALRNLKQNANFIRYAVQRFLRAVRLVQKFCRQIYLRQAAVATRQVDLWIASDRARGVILVNVDAEVRRLILRTEYHRQRAVFRAAWLQWRKQLQGVQMQYTLAASDRALSAVAKDRLAYVSVRLTQLRNKEPRFAFRPNFETLLAHVSAHLRKEVATRVESVMLSLGLTTNDPAFISGLVDRYEDVIAQHKRHAEVAATTARRRMLGFPSPPAAPRPAPPLLTPTAKGFGSRPRSGAAREAAGGSVSQGPTRMPRSGAGAESETPVGAAQPRAASITTPATVGEPSLSPSRPSPIGAVAFSTVAASPDVAGSHHRRIPPTATPLALSPIQLSCATPTIAVDGSSVGGGGVSASPAIAFDSSSMACSAERSPTKGKVDDENNVNGEKTVESADAAEKGANASSSRTEVAGRACYEALGLPHLADYNSFFYSHTTVEASSRFDELESEEDRNDASHESAVGPAPQARPHLQYQQRLVFAQTIEPPVGLSVLSERASPRGQQPSSARRTRLPTRQSNIVPPLQWCVSTTMPMVAAAMAEGTRTTSLRRSSPTRRLASSAQHGVAAPPSAERIRHLGCATTRAVNLRCDVGSAARDAAIGRPEAPRRVLPRRGVVSGTRPAGVSLRPYPYHRFYAPTSDEPPGGVDAGTSTEAPARSGVEEGTTDGGGGGLTAPAAATAAATASSGSGKNASINAYLEGSPHWTNGRVRLRTAADVVLSRFTQKAMTSFVHVVPAPNGTTGTGAGDEKAPANSSPSRSAATLAAQQKQRESVLAAAVAQLKQERADRAATGGFSQVPAQESWPGHNRSVCCVCFVWSGSRDAASVVSGVAGLAMSSAALGLSLQHTAGGTNSVTSALAASTTGAMLSASCDASPQSSATPAATASSLPATMPDFIATGSHDGALRIWDIARGDTVAIEQHQDRVSCVVSTTRFVCSGSDDGTLRVLQKRTWRCVHVFRHRSWITVMAETNDFVISSGYDAVVAVWDLAGPTPVQYCALEGHVQRVSALAHNGTGLDGGTLVSGSDDGSVRVWAGLLRRAAAVGGGTGRLKPPRFSLGGPAYGEHNGSILTVSHLHGDMFVSSATDGFVRVWNCVTLGTLMQLFANCSEVRAVTPVSAGLVCISGSDGSNRIVNTATGAAVAELWLPSPTESSVLLEGQRMLLLGSSAGAVYCVDTLSAQVTQVLVGNRGAVNQIAACRDCVATASDDRVVCFYRTTQIGAGAISAAPFGSGSVSCVTAATAGPTTETSAA